MATNDQVADRIRVLIRSAPAAEMLGAKLAQHLREDPGYSSSENGRIRDFIEQHVPEVIRLHQRGKDWVYGLRSSLAKGSEVAPAIAERDSSQILKIWRTLASPQSNFRLFVNPRIAELRVHHMNQSPDAAEWTAIPSCTIAQLEADARDWVASLPDQACRNQLSQALDGGSGPKSQFLRMVQDSGLSGEWTTQRREAILARFAALLQELGFPEIPILAEKIRQVLKQSRSNTMIGSPHYDSRAALRALLIEAIKRMPEAELRALNIPIGYIFDTLPRR